MEHCLFCRIIAGEIPGPTRPRRRARRRVQGHQPAGAAARADRAAPAHRTLNDLQPDDDQLIGVDVPRAPPTGEAARLRRRAATAPSSTPTATPARPCSTSICTCSPAASLHWPPGIDRSSRSNRSPIHEASAEQSPLIQRGNPSSVRTTGTPRSGVGVVRPMHQHAAHAGALRALDVVRDAVAHHHRRRPASTSSSSAPPRRCSGAAS